MLNFFSKKNKIQKAKAAILDGFFSYSDQKKAITRAAKESARDQKKMVEEYRKLQPKTTR